MKRLPSHLRSTSRAVALEPRLLFDGAGAVAAADALTEPASQPPQDAPAPDQAHQTDSAVALMEASAAAQSDSAAGLFGAEQDGGISAAPGGSVLLVVDARVADYADLLQGQSGNVQVRVVGQSESGLSVITDELAKGGVFDAIHIVSHGESGSLTLGADVLRSDSISEQSSELQRWAGYLADDADILLYACNVAQGEQGQALIAEIAQLTRADVVASDDATGAASKGGDWDLERSTGAIESGMIFTSTSMAAYGELMAAPTLKDGAPKDEPASIGENTGGLIGKNITVSGTGTDILTASASVLNGTLNSSGSTLTSTGTAAQIQDWLATLTYSYTGTSETGDQDTLKVTVVNTVSGGETPFTRVFEIAPENDKASMAPPAAGSGRLSVSEGGSQAFTAATGNGTVGNPVVQINLGLSDPDNTANQLIIKLTSLPTQGVLKLNGVELTISSTFALSDISKLVYQHNGAQVLSQATDTFTITVDDGAGGVLTGQIVNVDLTPKNDAPSISGNIQLIEGEQDVPLVGGKLPAVLLEALRGDLSITDPDDNLSQMTVVVDALPANGILKYSGVAVVSGQVITNANLALFTYSHNGSETTSDTFNLTVTDAGGGEGAPKSSVSTVIELNIIPNNDDPFWVGNQPNAEGEFVPVVFGPDSGTANTGNALTLTGGMLEVDDAESPPERLTYTLTGIPAGGYLTHSGFPGKSLPVGFSFTQKEINEGKISFVAYSGNSFDTSFSFTVKDGDRSLIPNRDGGIHVDESSEGLVGHRFYLSFKGTATGEGPGTPLEAAPLPELTGSSKLTITDIAEGQSYTLTTAQLSATSTGVPAEQLTFRLLTLPSNGDVLLGGVKLNVLGSFTQKDINEGRVTFRHNGSEDFDASFSYDISNGDKITAPQAFTIEAKPQNDTPTAGNGSVIKVLEGGSQVINAGGVKHIVLTDADNSLSDRSDGYAADNSLSFEVTSLPAHGSLWLDGVKQSTAGFIVTQAQLDAGLLRYTHDGSETYTDNFVIVPVDDKSVTTGKNLTNANTHGPSQVADPNNQVSTGDPVTIKVTINPLNDAPVIVSKGEPGYGAVPLLKEGGELVIGGGTYAGGAYGTGSGPATPADPSQAHLLYRDSDNSSEQRQYRITAAPQYGTLTVAGRVMGVGSIFTQAELDAGQVKYKHGGGEGLADKFLYVVSDGDWTANDTKAFAQGSAATAAEFRILLERSNDKPLISSDHTGTLVVDSKSVGSGTALPVITLGDIDLDGTLATGEQDFVQITVEFLQEATGLPYAAGQLAFNGGSVPAGVIVTNAVGDNTLTFQGTLADVRAALAAVRAMTDGSDPDRSDLQIKVTIDDRLRDASGALTAGANGGVSNQDGSVLSDASNRASVVFNVAASDTNDAPVITNSSTSYSVNEDETRTLGGFTLSDADSFDKVVSVTVSLFSDSGYNTLATDAQGLLKGPSTAVPGVSLSATSGNAITLTGTMADVQAALNQMRFEGAADFNGTVKDSSGTLYLRTEFNDFAHAGGSELATLDRTISVVPVNDKPVLSVPGNQVMASGSFIDIKAGFSVQDSKDTSQGATDFIEVTLDARLEDESYGTLTLGSTTDVTLTGSGSTITVSGTNAAVSAALNTLRFTPDKANLDAVVTINVSADDKHNGQEVVGVNGNNTDAQSFTITVSGSNDAPQVTAPGTVTVAEDSAGKAISGISYTDKDDFGGTQQVTLTVTHGVLNFTDKTGLNVTAGAYGTASVTIEGTKAALNAALATLTYKPVANFHGSDTLTVTANDKGLVGAGGAQTDSKTVAITVTAVNDRPTATTDVTLPAITEDSTSAGVTFASQNFGYSDATDDQTSKSGGNTLTPHSYVAIVGNAATAEQGTWQVADGSGGWINIPASGLSDTAALVFSASREVRFVAADNYNGTPGKLTIRLADGSQTLLNSTGASDRKNLNDTANGDVDLHTGAWSVDKRTISISVTAVNDAPTRVLGTDPVVTVAEDSSSHAGKTVSELFSGLFSDVKDTVTSGSSANSFAGVAIVDSESGKGKWQYSTNSGSTWLDVPADVAEGSALVLKGSDQLRFVSTTPDYNGTPTDSLTVRLVDNSSTITSGSRPDLSGSNSGGTTAYSSAADEVRLSAVVTPLNDAPLFTHTPTSPTITENSSTGSGESVEPTKLLGSGTVSDIDLAGTTGLDSTLFGAGSITVSLSSALGSDVVRLEDGLVVGAASGIASISGGSNSSPLVITLRADASVAQVKAILEAIEFINTSDNPTEGAAQRALDYSITLADGNNDQGPANAGGPLELSNTVSGTITLIPANDPPLAKNDSNSVTENSGIPATGNVITGTGTDGAIKLGEVDSDPDTPTGNLLITNILPPVGGSGGGSVPADGLKLQGKYGELTIQPDGSYSYELDNSNTAVNDLSNGETLTEAFTYTLSDGAKTDTADLTITIIGDTDGPPVLTPAAAVAAVSEKGLTSTIDQSEVVSGTINMQVSGGLNSITIAGKTFTVAELIGFASTPSAAIDTGKGYLVITGLTDVAGPTATPLGGKLHWEYTLKQAQSTPGADTSQDVINLTVSDNNNGDSPGTLTITIHDDAPEARDDVRQIQAGHAGEPSVSLTGNVIDAGITGDVADTEGADGAVLSHIDGKTVVSGDVITGLYGDLQINADGSYTYILDNTKAAAEPPGALSEQFEYTLTDADGDLSKAQLTIEIGRPPSAVDDNASTVEDTPVGGNLLLGDSDPDADPLTVIGYEIGGAPYSPGSTANIPGVGSILIKSDGSYEFTPAPNWNGSVPDITYTISDGNGGSDSAVLKIVVTPVQDAPVAVDDSTTTAEDTPVGGNLLPNDSDPDADPLTVTDYEIGGVPYSPGSSANIPGVGSIVIKPDGSYEFTPAPNWNGTVPDITYTISDGNGGSDSAVLKIVVTPVNDAPVATDDSATTREDTPVGGNLLPNDSDPDADPLTVIGYEIGGTSYRPGSTANIPGVGSILIKPDGSYAFTPVPNWNGSVPDITYTISDGNGGSDSAVLKIVVTPVNDVPVAVDDRFTTPGNTPLTGVLTGNDTPSGDGGNNWTLVTPPSNGSVTINPDGSFTYVPVRNFNGTDSFTYVITDVDGSTSTATVWVNVERVDDYVHVPAAQPTPGNPYAPSTYSPLAPLNPAPWLRPQVFDPSVYFPSEVNNPVIRLPIPMHPVLFVNREVNQAQSMREQADTRASGNVDMAQALRMRSQSMAMGLGFVPDQFVMAEVANSHVLAQGLAGRIDGRFERISLGSDGLIETPDWRQPDPQLLTRAVAPAPQGAPQDAETPPANQADAPRNAPSFSEQLRSGGSRLPMASR